jgi:hypothetical protein
MMKFFNCSKRVIVIRMHGGLGNQMFQYAMARVLSIKNNMSLVLDIGDYNKKNSRNFELEGYGLFTNVVKRSGTLLRVLSRIGVMSFYKEDPLNYDSCISNIKGNVYFEGYFQSEKYFLEFRSIILRELTFKKDLSCYSKTVEKKIILEKCSCSIHIRRGDYFSNKNTGKIHGVLDLNYYKNAINIIKKNNKNVMFFVFSDDMEWVKNNFNFKNVFFIDHCQEVHPGEDVKLMSLCNHNIVANSSFSWWGGWLNSHNDKIVIAPKQWFSDEKRKSKIQDIIPSDWIQI